MCKFRSLLVIIIFFFLLTSLDVFSQEKKEIIKFTIEKSIKTALDNSLELSSIEQDIMASEAKISQAETGKNPSFSANAYYSRVHPLPVLSLDGKEFQLGVEDQAQITFTFNYPLYDGSLTSNLTNEATFFKESLLHDREAVRQDVIFNVIEGDYSVLKSQALLSVSEKNLEASQEQLRIVNAFYIEGLVPMSDLFNAKAQVANAELDVIKTKNNIEYAKSLLKHILSIPLDYPIEIEGDVPDEPAEADLDYITNLAYENRQEIKKMEMLTLAARAAIDVARSARKPYIYFNFDYIPATSLAFTESNSLAATVGASIPIFDRGLTTYKIEEAEANLKKSEISIEQVKKNVALQVKESYLELVNTKEEVDKLEESLKSAEQNYTASTLRYKEGIAPFLEVTDSRALLTKAQTDKVKAQYSHFIAIARVIRSTGLLPDNGNIRYINLIDNSHGKEQ